MLSVNSTCLVFLKCFSDCIHWIDENIISNGNKHKGLVIVTFKSIEIEWEYSILTGFCVWFIDFGITIRKPLTFVVSSGLFRVIFLVYTNTNRHTADTSLLSGDEDTHKPIAHNRNLSHY